MRQNQSLKHDLRAVAHIEPSPMVLQRIRAEVGAVALPTKAHRRSRSVRVLALVACLPLVTVVVGATTLYPQTPEGAQRWLANHWAWQLARTEVGGGTTGLGNSTLGVTGFHHPSKLTWSVYGVARITLTDVSQPSEPELIAIGGPLPLTQDRAVLIARYLSPAIGEAIREFQQTHTQNPVTTITQDGKTQRWQGFGHFEVKATDGKVIITADVVPNP